MKLIAPTPPAELPGDALLARLRYRRSALAAAGGASGAGLADWTYRRLDRRLRGQLEPYFDLLAMRGLILTLRYALAGEPAPAALQEESLLDAGWRHLTGGERDAGATVAAVATALAPDYPFADGLVAAYRRQGPGGAELLLAEGILQHGLARARGGVMAATLRYLVDARNCLSLLKLWRWQVTRPPALPGGGELDRGLLLKIWAARDSERLARLIARRAGARPASMRPGAVEQCLLDGLSRLLRDAGRDPLGAGVVIDYLWRVRLAAHNRALRDTLEDGGGELLAEVLLP